MGWMGLDVSLESLKTLAQHPPPNVEIVIVPWVNVDKTAGEQDRLHNRLQYRRSNMNGVDLNRDYEINRKSNRSMAPFHSPSLHQLPHRPYLNPDHKPSKRCYRPCHLTQPSAFTGFWRLSLLPLGCSVP